MKLRALAVAIFILIFQTAGFTQTGYRMKQLANLNQHFVGQNLSYSALWGYTAPNGREYAILGCFTGTAFIDITDSLNIREVDFIPSPNNTSFGNAWREMKTYLHYAYVVSEAENSNIQIMDLQYLPDSVRYVGKFNIPLHSSTHSVSQSGPFLYLNGANDALSRGIAVVDLANPEVPVLRGRWNTYYVHDSRIVNDTIWACNINNGLISVIDARNKDSLRTIRSWVNNPPPNSPHNVALTTDRRFAFVSDETFSPSPGKMKIWDVSDLGNITYINSLQVFPFEGSIIHNIETVGNYAIVAYYSAGVKVYNISNPAAPLELAWFDTYSVDNSTEYNGCWGVYMFASGKIIASDQNFGLYVLRADLSTPAPRLPVCNFTVSKPEARKNDTLRLIDASDGIPGSWQWTVTGPETVTSSQKHPDIRLSSIGLYNVKLRVSNSFGSDSAVRTNFIRILPQQLLAFSVTSPLGVPTVRILTSPADTSKVLFSWRRSNSDPATNYRIYFRKIQSPGDYFIPSGNSGRDTAVLLSKSYLDSLALRMGTTGDSVLVSYRVKAYNEADSLASTNTVTLVLKRTSVNITPIATGVPAEYRLYDNYPNPFNPATVIRFDVPKAGVVSLVLYDIAGRVVSQLVNDHLPPGSYRYTLNSPAAASVSGVMFLRFRAGGYSEVKRIVLLK